MKNVSLKTQLRSISGTLVFIRGKKSKKYIVLLCLCFPIFMACKKDAEKINVQIQNVTNEPIAVKITDREWVAINPGSTSTFRDYKSTVLENTQVSMFTKDESEVAFAAVQNCDTWHLCTDDEINPPYGGGVKSKFFDLRRKTRVNFGEEIIPTAIILAEKIDSLTNGVQERNVEKITLRLLN